MVSEGLRVSLVIRILIGACLPVIALGGAFAQSTPVELGTIEVQSNTESATGPVDGYVATRSATGAKTDTPLKEIPQSITVVTADRMKDQGVETIQQAFRYVPGVFADPYGPDSRVDGPTIRGVDVDTYLDGMRTTNSWFNYQRIEPYTLERAEVLRGPASVLYGATTTGGMINLVSKRPQAQDLHEVGVQYGSFNRKQIQTDHTGKITADGDWLYRVIGVFRDSDYQTDYVKDDRVLVMPSISWRPTNMTNWTVMATYPKDKTGSSTGFLPHSGTIFANPNGRIPINRFAGDPATDLYQTETRSITSLFEHRFNEVLKVSHNMRYQSVDGIYHSVYSNSFMANPYLDPAQRTVSRYVDWWDTHRKTLTSDSNAELKFNTGPLAHKILVGFDYRRMSETGAAGGYVDATPFDLYAPVYNPIVPPPMFVTPDLVQKQAGVYAQDQVRWGALIGTYGLRYDRASSAIEGQPIQTDKALTWRAGLMYELPFGLSPYVSYAQSFTPQFGTAVYGNSACVDSANGLCKPVRGEQYEAGFKFSQSKNLVINGAVFDITQENRLATNPNGVGSVQTGKARIRGAELEVLATLFDNLDVIAAYTYLDAKVLEGDNAGSRIETVPQNQASLWAKYRFAVAGLRGFSAGAGVRYIGAVWDGTDTIQTPGYTLYDAMFAWENAEWRFQVNGTNLGDKQYFTACLARGDCFYGTGRTVLAQLTYKFGAGKTEAAKP
ncbi:MAG: TonB-dependent siderophore receptor [Xanthobacteraceae bacterium]